MIKSIIAGILGWGFTFGIAYGNEANILYEKAYFLETGKGQASEALKIYRQLAATEVDDANRAAVRKALKRMLVIYGPGQVEAPKIDEYFARLNLDFERGPRSEKMPAPSLWGGGGQGYEIVVDDKVKHGGTYACRIAHQKGGTFASITGGLKAEMVRGKRLKFSGMMKLEDVSGYAGLWMRSDVGDQVAATFYNMQDQKIKGTRDWKPYSFELDIPADATNINFGSLVSGKGTLWVDDLKLEVVKSVSPF